MEQLPDQSVDLEAKRRARRTIALFYQIEKMLLYLYIAYVGLLLLTLLLALVFIRTAWGAYVLSGAVPWLWILPISLCIAFAFPLVDSFIQGSEEKWFERYGTTILTAVEGFDAIKGFKWRFFFGDVQEYRARLTWRQPETQRMYSYSLRVRDQKLPREGSALPVVVDGDDPSYYLKRDIKDPSLLI